MDARRVKEIISSFQSKKVAVVGDLMLDVYLWGRVSRISQEAPVPVVHAQRKTYSLGGASNVMKNVAALGGRVEAFGVVGCDEHGSRLISMLDDNSVSRASVYKIPGRTTTEKQRVIAGNQQLVRIDFEETGGVPDAVREKIARTIRQSAAAGKIDAVIFEDYAKGVLSQELATDIVGTALAAGMPTGLDPHPSHIIRTKRITFATPNRAEAFAVSGTYFKETFRPVEKDTALADVASKLQKIWNPDQLLVTLGGDGMALFQKRKPCIAIPTKAREVFDVTGAGDTVIAAYMLSLLGGASPLEAATVANHAAGIVVAKIGAATASPEELIKSFEE